MNRTVIVFLLLSIVTLLVSAQPNMALLGINSTQSRAVISNFLAQNPTINTQLNNVSSLPINTSFTTLFDYIFTNSSVYDQLIPNTSVIVPFAWTTPLTQSEKKALL
jgi:hypothetical protein